MRGRAFGLGLLCALLVQMEARAQDWEARWKNLIAKAQGQTLVLAVQPMSANVALAAAFEKRFPGVKVELTQLPANKFVPRVLAEQKSGIHAWDAWLGQVSNIAFYLLPTGGIEKMTDYLFLPEVTDLTHWRAPDYLYAYGAGPYVFVYSLPIERTIYANTDRLAGVKLAGPDSLLDPRLKGRIGIRVADHPGAGAVTLAALMKDKGGEGAAYARRLLMETGATFYDNPRQITTSVMRGEMAVIVGAGVDTIDKCKLAGGCRNIVVLDFGQSLNPRGIAILKKPPHPEAATLWSNWVLSREGQETFIREGAKSEVAGMVSMRKDVAPAKGQESSLPDYGAPGKFLAMGTKDGEHYVNDAMTIFRSVRAEQR